MFGCRVVPSLIVISGPKPNPSFIKCHFCLMKAPIAQAGGEAAFPPAFSFFFIFSFFLGLEIVNFKKLGFRLGSIFNDPE